MVVAGEPYVVAGRERRDYALTTPKHMSLSDLLSSYIPE